MATPDFAKRKTRPGAASLRVEIPNVRRLQSAFRALAEADAPFIDEALKQGAADDFIPAIKRHAPGAIGREVRHGRVLGSPPGRRISIIVEHPGSKPMEFGRSFYWSGYTVAGGRISGGRKTRHTPGQRPRPFVGVVKGDAAVGEVGTALQKRFSDAIEAEFLRLANMPGEDGVGEL